MMADQLLCTAGRLARCLLCNPNSPSSFCQPQGSEILLHVVTKSLYVLQNQPHLNLADQSACWHWQQQLRYAWLSENPAERLLAVFGCTELDV
jgi:hypothetical protein